MSLGKLEKVDLRTVWANEATDFTPWLAKAENLEELSNTVGMELEVTAMEQFVGPFRADLLCKDAISQEAVLIENQLEKSNHTHLGQILTYAPGLNVRAIIWIASKFTEEHRAALDWLNEVTEENISFFGLEVELWKIGNSEPAPKFNIISRPNNWNKNLREVAQNSGSGEVSTTKLQQMKYWQALREYLLENNSNIRPQKASPQHWTNFSIGRSDFYMGARVNSRENYIAVYLNFRNLQSKEVFHAFHTDKEKIEKDFGRELVWDELPDAKECTIYTVLKNTDFRDEDNWQNQFSWIKESLESLDRSFRKRIRDLVLN